MQNVLTFLRTRAENVQALMMAVMFAAFIAQVMFRYVFNLPLAWTEEVCTIVWLWGILWGASFVMRSRDDVRFDMVYNLASRRARRVLTTLASSSIVIILLSSLPAAWSYVAFMKVEKSANLMIPMNWMYSIYIVFVLAMVGRHASIAWDATQNRLVEDEASTGGSTL